MLCVCVGDVMDVVVSVCIVRRGAVGAPVWEVWVFRHADVVFCVSYASRDGLMTALATSVSFCFPILLL